MKLTNCNHAVHAPKISYFKWSSNDFNKYSHCQGDCLHGCMLKITSESERQMNKERKWGKSSKGKSLFPKINKLNNFDSTGQKPFSCIFLILWIF